MLPADPAQAGPPTADSPQGAMVPQPRTQTDPTPRLPHQGKAGGSPPAALSARPHLLGLLFALRRRWLLAVGLGLFCAAAAAAVAWYLLPPTSTVRTLL